MDMSRREFLQAGISTGIGLGSTLQGSPQRKDLSFLTISELSELIRTRKISPVEITQTILERIETLNPAVNAYITITQDVAMKAAREAESEIQRKKWHGPLHGVPIAVKDLFDTVGVRTTAGSALFKDRVPDQDAEVIRKLKMAGAVLLGKTNMHEFAFGGNSLVTHFGAVHGSLGISPGDRQGDRLQLLRAVCVLERSDRIRPARSGNRQRTAALSVSSPLTVW